jgi:hypothetical protein
MKIQLLILFTLKMTSLTAWAQDIDSSKIKERIERLVRDERVSDSLEAVFYSEPPSFNISFSRNQKNMPIPKGSMFYATDGQIELESTRLDSVRYEFSDLPDSVRFGLQFDSMKIETGFVRRRAYMNGGTLTFGYYDNILELRRKWEKAKNDKDFDDAYDIDPPYLMAVKDNKIIKAARKGKIRPIQFVIFVPRVYGDGMVFTFQSVRLK